MSRLAMTVPGRTTIAAPLRCGASSMVEQPTCRADLDARCMRLSAVITTTGTCWPTCGAGSSSAPAAAPLLLGSRTPDTSGPAI